MPLSLSAMDFPAWSTMPVLEETGNVSVRAFSVGLESWFRLLTVIEITPFVAPFAAVYLLSVPRSTNRTCGGLGFELAVVAGAAATVAAAVVVFVAWLFACVLAGVVGC